MAKAKLSFDEKNCKGCLLCAVACPQKILELDGDKINAKGYNPITVTDEEKCIACAMCAVICPDSVIRVEREAR